MNYKIIILPKAFLEMEDITIWYENLKKGLGKRFLHQLKSQVNIIKGNPFLFQIKYDKTYVAKTKDFPYLIHFEIDGNKIVIKAIMHTSRNSQNYPK